MRFTKEQVHRAVTKATSTKCVEHTKERLFAFRIGAFLGFCFGLGMGYITTILIFVSK